VNIKITIDSYKSKTHTMNIKNIKIIKYVDRYIIKYYFLSKRNVLLLHFSKLVRSFKYKQMLIFLYHMILIVLIHAYIYLFIIF